MIQSADVFRVFQEHRGNAIVIPTGTSGRHWRDYSTNENRDLNMGGAMGQTTSAALGLALGLPDEKVVLFDAEGALLMNLGILATISGKQPQNFCHFLLDNECYATTGGQPVPTLRTSTMPAWPRKPATLRLTALKTWKSLPPTWSR